LIIKSFLRSLIRPLLLPGLFITLLALPVAVFAAGADTAGKVRPQQTVLVLGDSISAAYGMSLEQGWVALLAQRLAAEYPSFRVVNASMSGETTVGGRARLPALLVRHQPAVVIIELGGNDGLNGYPIASLRNNLRAMTAAALDAGAEVLLVTMDVPPNYGPATIRQRFSDSYRIIAKDLGAAVTPSLFESIATDPDLMQSDNIHPTVAAQPLLLDLLWPHIEALLQSGGRSTGP